MNIEYLEYLKTFLFFFLLTRCNISFESWGHTSHYIVLTWLREKRKFSDSIALAQFDLDVNFVEEPLSNFSILGKISLDMAMTNANCQS